MNFDCFGMIAAEKYDNFKYFVSNLLRRQWTTGFSSILIIKDTRVHLIKPPLLLWTTHIAR